MWTDVLSVQNVKIDLELGMSKIKTLEEMILEIASKPEPSKEEVNIRTCKVCQLPKKRIYDGKYNFKDNRWIDETGKQWMGRTCPECNKQRAKGVMANARKKNQTKNPDSGVSLPDSMADVPKETD
jgi:ssDNA-binding Zn-finger/Zn-ribbon topoisomerase 1